MILYRIAIFASSLSLVSCGTLLSPPPIAEKAPDTIIKPTTTIVPRDTEAELPKGTWVKTDRDEKTEALLEEDTLVTVKPTTDVPIQSQQPPLQVVLPKNTEVIIPENTYLQTSETSKVRIEASSEVVLPVGTEISITKINWYAILFYALAIGGIAWYYMQGKTEDSNQDGYVDEPKSPKSKDSAPS